MNKILALLTIFSLSTALAAEPDPTAWYTPSAEDYTPPEGYDALAEIVDARGTAHVVNFMLTVGEDGYITESSLKASLSDIKLSVNTAIDLIDLTLRETGNNLLAIERLDAQFAALGKNLTKVFQIDGMKIKIGGKSYSLRIPAGSLRQAIQTGTTVEYHDEDGLFVTADNKTLMDATSGGIRMIGWKSVPGADPSLAQTVNGEIKWQPVKSWTDKSSLNTDDSGALQISGWNTASPGTGYTLAEVLTDDGRVLPYVNDYIITRSAEGTLNYVRIGSLSLDSAADVDGVSIITNTTSGTDALSLAGFADAEKDSIPYRGNTSLEWMSLSDLVDGKSINVTDGRLEVRGASVQQAARRYFGTGTTSADIGWYDLPNVTTNIVEGDEKTITTVENDGKVKTLGLKSMPLPVPSVAANNGGEILWMPLAEVVTNAALLVDNVTVTTNGEDTISIKGWADSICGAKVSEMLTEEGNEDRGKHYLLARYGTGASAPLHYVPLGNSISQLAADGEALIEKEDGVITIAGYPNATEGQVLTHTGSGVTWTEPTGTEYTAGEGIIINEDAEEPTISVDPDYLNSVVGERTAVDGTFVIRDENDIITIDTNLLVQASVDAAVAEMPVADGLSIIEKEDYTLTIAGFADAGSGAVLERSVDGVEWVAKDTIQIVTDVRLDPDTQQLQKKTAYLTFVGILDEESDWEDL